MGIAIVLIVLIIRGSARAIVIGDEVLEITCCDFPIKEGFSNASGPTCSGSCCACP